MLKVRTYWKPLHMIRPKAQIVSSPRDTIPPTVYIPFALSIKPMPGTNQVYGPTKMAPSYVYCPWCVMKSANAWPWWMGWHLITLCRK